MSIHFVYNTDFHPDCRCAGPRGPCDECREYLDKIYNPRHVPVTQEDNVAAPMWNAWFIHTDDLDVADYFLAYVRNNPKEFGLTGE